MQTCELCETAEATLLKAERDEEIVDADGAVTGMTVRLVAICAGCAGDWYDGTEDFPGTIPLTELAAAVARISTLRCAADLDVAVAV